MARLLHIVPLLLVVACNTGSDDDGSDDTNNTDDTDGMIPFEFDAKGDFSCFTPAATFDAVTWAPAQQVIDPGTVTVNGFVQDFESEDPATSRIIEMWHSDTVAGTADSTNANDSSANVTITDTPSCQPVSWLAKEEPGLDEAKPTYKAHQVYGPGSGGNIDAEFNSVSIDTYLLIPTIVGISIDPAKGAIAGTMYDCSRDPDTLPSIDAGKVEGVRVRLRDAEGNVPDGAEIKYFIDNFPDRDQPWTSDDGLWGIFNIPEGTWVVEAYAQVGGEEVVVGATVAEVFVDSINIGNIWAGYADGIKYPAACIDAGGDTDTDQD